MAGRTAIALISLLACCAGCAVAPQGDSAPSFPRSARIGELRFVKDLPVSAIVLPAARGGNIDPDASQGELSDYSFDPAKLPVGLRFDRFTRVLSGVPRLASRPRTYHLWIHDDDENFAVSDADSLRFSIEVTDGEERKAQEEVADAPPDRLTASFESEFQWFQKGVPPKLSRNATWRSVAWRGERIQKHILVRGISRRDGVSVAASDLKSRTGGVIPAAAVSFRHPRFVIGDIEARDCEGYPERNEVALLSDALFSAPGADRPVADAEVVWMSIDVPRAIRPGEYAGAVTVRSGAAAQATLQVALAVVPWRLAPVSEWTFHLDLWQFPTAALDRYNDANPGRRIAAWSQAHYRLLEPFYRYLATLGQRAVTAHIKPGALGAPSMIQWIALNGGKRWRYDYSAFDAHVERMAAWGIDAQINAFSLVGWNKDEIPFLDGVGGKPKAFRVAVGSKAYNALWNRFLTDFKAHLLEKGWFAKTVLYMDEVPQDEMEAVIGLIRHNDPDWKIGLAYGHAPDPRVVASLYDVSGYYESEMDVRTDEGQLTTFYTSCSLQRPNNYVAADADPADLAAMAWYAKARGHDGYLRWAYDNWKAAEPLDLRDGAFTAGDYSFVYRTGNGADMTAAPSVRSELLRDGIEDYEKIQALEATLRRCGERGPLERLRKAVAEFSNEELMAGQAEKLVSQGRRELAALSASVAPGACR